MVGHRPLHMTLTSLSFSRDGATLVGSGRLVPPSAATATTPAPSTAGKAVVALWQAARPGAPAPPLAALNGGYALVAQSTTSADVRVLRVAPTHDNVVVSCGRNQVRVWRRKDAALRSSPVDLAAFHDPAATFTAVAFPALLPGNRSVVCVVIGLLDHFLRLPPSHLTS
jgi:hypothetical protein